MGLGLGLGSGLGLGLELGLGLGLGLELGQGRVGGRGSAPTMTASMRGVVPSAAMRGVTCVRVIG